jgi:PAS domain S-box-containing protein
MTESDKTKVPFLHEMEEIPDLIANLEREAFERQKIVEIFRASEAKLRLVRDHVPAAIWTTDRQLRLTSALGTAFSALDLDPAHSIGASLAEFFQIDDPQAPALDAAQGALNGESGSYEFTRSGRTYGVLVQPLRDGDDVAGTVAIAVDITSRAREEADLRAAASRFRKLFEEAPLPCHEVDSEGKLTAVNNAEATLLGFEASEMTGKPLWALAASERQEEVRATIQRRMAGEPLAPYECEFVKREGARVTLELHESLIRDGSGAPVGIRAACLDVTERSRIAEQARQREGELRAANEEAQERARAAWAQEKASWDERKAAWEAEQARWEAQKATLEQEKARLEQIDADQKAVLENLEQERCRVTRVMDLSSEGIAVTDLSGNSVYYNRAFLDLYGYSAEELNSLGGAAAIFVKPEIAGEVAAAIQNGRPWQGETDMKAKDGRIVPVMLRAEAVANQAGSPVGLVVVCTDATLRKRAELYESERNKVAELVARIEPLEKVLGQLSQLAGRPQH